MKGFRPIVAACLTGCLLPLPAGVAQAAFYRWVDEQGVVHYSDQLPPEYTRRRHELLDENGRKLKEIEAAKTRQQLLEERRRAAREAEERRRREAQEAYDRALLATFSSVEEMDKLRDERLAILDMALHRARAMADKVRGRLNAARQRRERLKAAGRPISEQLRANIAELERQLRDYRDQIARNEQRRKELLAKSARDRARYLELTAQQKQTQDEPQDF